MGLRAAAEAGGGELFSVGGPSLPQSQQLFGSGAECTQPLHLPGKACLPALTSQMETPQQDAYLGLGCWHWGSAPDKWL